MPELVTLGETMAVLTARERGPLRYVRDYSMRIAGAESNVAVGVTKLGHSAGWISSIGKDEMGAFVRNSMRAEGVDTSRVAEEERYRTGLMLKELGSHETKVYYYRENSAASHMDESHLDADYICQAKILHMTGITPVLGESCARMVRAAVRLACQEKILLSFDPNIRKKLWGYRDYGPLIREIMFASGVVLLGRDEAGELLGTTEPDRIVAILRKEGVRWIAVKDGAAGAWVADQKDLIQIPPYPCCPADPVGAGDAFDAAFLAGILENRSLEVCGQMGAVAGALVTETQGDTEGFPSRETLQRCLEKKEEIYR